MRIEFLDQAELDLLAGYHFYEDQEPGLGTYFLTCLYADIESLRIYAGVHRKAYKHYHRLLSRRFPFAMFYAFQNGTVFVQAVLDCRRDPAWTREKLK